MSMGTGSSSCETYFPFGAIDLFNDPRGNS